MYVFTNDSLYRRVGLAYSFFYRLEGITFQNQCGYYMHLFLS